jgi:hypothetical protein
MVVWNSTTCEAFNSGPRDPEDFNSVITEHVSLELGNCHRLHKSENEAAKAEMQELKQQPKPTGASVESRIEELRNISSAGQGSGEVILDSLEILLSYSSAVGDDGSAEINTPRQWTVSEQQNFIDTIEAAVEPGNLEEASRGVGGATERTKLMKDVSADFVSLTLALATGMLRDATPGAVKTAKSGGLEVRAVRDAKTDLVGKKHTFEGAGSSAGAELYLPTSFATEGKLPATVDLVVHTNPTIWGRSSFESETGVEFLSRSQGIAIVDSTDGSEVAISGLQTPIEITIPLTTNISATDQLACRFWNVAAVTWDRTGCTLRSQSASSATCACNHLTEFAVTTLGGGESLQPGDREADPNTDAGASSSNPLPMVVGGVVGALLLVAVVAGVVVHTRKAPVGTNQPMRARMDTENPMAAGGKGTKMQANPSFDASKLEGADEI